MTINIYDTALFSIVKRCGSVNHLAQVLGVSRQVVYIWVKQGGAPVKRAIQLEEIYGVPRRDLVVPKLRAFFDKANASGEALVAYTPRT